MITIDKNILAFEKMQTDLEAEHMNKWALVYNQELIKIFESFDEAAIYAVGKYKQGSYLIRQIGINSVVLPVAVMMRQLNA